MGYTLSVRLSNSRETWLYCFFPQWPGIPTKTQTSQPVALNLFQMLYRVTSETFITFVMLIFVKLLLYLCKLRKGLQRTLLYDPGSVRQQNCKQTAYPRQNLILRDGKYCVYIVVFRTQILYSCDEQMLHFFSISVFVLQRCHSVLFNYQTMTRSIQLKLCMFWSG